MKPHRTAFSLLEVLVAVTITAVLLVLMATVATQSLGIWGRGQSSSTVALEAKLVLDQLQRDLQAIVLRRESNVWVAVDVNEYYSEVTKRGWDKEATERIKPEGPSSRRFTDGDGNSRGLNDIRWGFSGVWIRLVTTKLDSNAGASSASSPVVVGYQILRRGFGAKPEVDARYALYRSEATQAASFAEGYHVGDGNYNVASSLDGTAGSIYSPSTSRLLATNVVDFGIRLYGGPRINGSLGLLFPVNSNSYRIDQNALPEAADICVRVLSEEGATLVAAMERGLVAQPANVTFDEWWWKTVERHSTIFARRVKIVAAQQ